VSGACAIERCSPSSAPFPPQPPPKHAAPLDVQNRELALNRILELDDFERFVFVITVLEHYSDHDSTVGPNYKRPAVNTPGIYRGSTSEAAATDGAEELFRRMREILDSHEREKAT
jgi:hypothetical protein